MAASNPQLSQHRTDFQDQVVAKPNKFSFAKGTVWFRNVLGVLLLGMMLLAAFTVLAYPSRSIKIIVPYAAGGAVDIVTRAIAQPLAEALKQPVIVDNRPGASANIGMELAAKSPPDGYVLLMASNAIATNMALFPHLAFDGQHDFLPIAKIGYAPLVIVVPASSPAKSLKDLIAMAKAQPGTLTYASAGNGRATWRASCSSRRRRSMPCTNPIEVLAHIRGGRLRALAVASDKRLSLLPDVPTVAEAGVPGYEASVWWGLVAPAKTPVEIVQRLNVETNKALANPAIASKLGESRSRRHSRNVGPVRRVHSIADRTLVWRHQIRPNPA